MKVKAKIDCIGVGYDLKAGETAALDKDIAKKLIRFNYVEEVKVSRKPRETKVKK